MRHLNLAHEAREPHRVDLLRLTHLHDRAPDTHRERAAVPDRYRHRLRLPHEDRQQCS
ncbi:MAG: hypothetical protein IPM79_39955 [Polyangiaceae bacterium]|nr:hypothetical protein [Polyangiaceae bacterium]